MTRSTRFGVPHDDQPAERPEDKKPGTEDAAPRTAPEQERKPPPEAPLLTPSPEREDKEGGPEKLQKQIDDATEREIERNTRNATNGIGGKTDADA